MVGLPTFAGFETIAVANTKQRASSIGPGDLIDDKVTAP